MPYRFVEDVAIADVAFEARGETFEEVLVAAADATMNVMVTDLDTIEPKEERQVRVTADREDLLLVELLQQIIYYKDAEQLLLRVPAVRLSRQEGTWRLLADAVGERIDMSKHPLDVDVKAVTLHQLRVERTEAGWRAFVILDI